MVNFDNNSTNVVAVTLLFLLIGLMSYQQLQRIPFTAEAGELACIDYDEDENTITINCNASFRDVVQTINEPEILENLGNGEYILNANLEVADDITFSMTSTGDGLQYLKLAGENGIIVFGKILTDGIRITSWNILQDDVIHQ